MRDYHLKDSLQFSSFRIMHACKPVMDTLIEFGRILALAKVVDERTHSRGAAILNVNASLNDDEMLLSVHSVNPDEILLHCMNYNIKSCLRLKLPKERDNKIMLSFHSTISPLVLYLISAAGSLLTLDLSSYVSHRRLPMILFSDSLSATGSSRQVSLFNMNAKSKQITPSTLSVEQTLKLVVNVNPLGIWGICEPLCMIKLSMSLFFGCSGGYILEVATTEDGTESKVLIKCCNIDITEIKYMTYGRSSGDIVLLCETPKGVLSYHRKLEDFGLKSHDFVHCEPNDIQEDIWRDHSSDDDEDDDRSTIKVDELHTPS